MSQHDSLPLEIDCRQLKRHLEAGDDLLLIDCREPEEHQIVRIDAATLVPMSQLVDRLGELEAHRGRHIVVHCHHGGRSMNVTRWLREQGFDKVQSLAGGIDQWSIDIDPSLPRY
jgi:rhodanese-related sulfurtransferase